jgi:plastocyanin
MQHRLLLTAADRMRIARTFMIRTFLPAVTLALLVGCSGGSSPSGPSGPGGGSGAGGGSMGGRDPTGAAAPLTAAVTVGNIFFKSGHNGSANPAVDTVAVGGTVTWTWTNSGNVPHSVQSKGSPSFTSSTIQTGDGNTHQVRFTTPGTYQYDCAVHGTMMSGTIVVR